MKAYLSLILLAACGTGAGFVSAPIPEASPLEYSYVSNDAGDAEVIEAEATIDLACPAPGSVNCGGVVCCGVGFTCQPANNQYGVVCNFPACPSGWQACGNPVSLCCDESQSHCEFSSTSTPPAFVCAAGSLMAPCMEDCKTLPEASTGD